MQRMLLLGLAASSLSAATVDTSRWFQVIKDPNSGVPVHVLKGSPEEHRQVLYYTQDMMSRDGRHLWFTSMLNPGTDKATKMLGLVDFESDGGLSHQSEKTASVPRRY